MSVPAYPAGLPKLEADSYVESPVDGTIRTQMDTGPEFFRRRFTATPTHINGDLNIDGSQVGTLLTFWKTTLRHGSLPFTWIDQRSGSAATFRFRAAPVIRAGSGNNFLATLQLEMLP